MVTPEKIAELRALLEKAQPPFDVSGVVFDPDGKLGRAEYVKAALAALPALLDAAEALQELRASITLAGVWRLKAERDQLRSTVERHDAEMQAEIERHEATKAECEAINASCSAAEKERDQLSAENEALKSMRSIGAQMANRCFNLAQAPTQPSEVQSHCDTMRRLHKEWDTALARLDALRKEPR